MLEEGDAYYQRPTLTGAGSFKQVTGLAALGPREMLVQSQLL
jgi:hypothetical protein